MTEVMEKSIPELKAEFVCTCVRDKKKKKFKVKKYKSPIQKGF